MTKGKGKRHITLSHSFLYDVQAYVDPKDGSKLPGTKLGLLTT